MGNVRESVREKQTEKWKENSKMQTQMRGRVGKRGRVWGREGRKEKRTGKTGLLSVIKHSDQKQLEEEGLIWLPRPDHSPLWRRVRTGNQGRNLESGAQAEP